VFENMKLNHQIKKSAQLAQEYADLTAQGLELLPERDKLQLECEQAVMLREACRWSRGPWDRQKMLTDQCAELERRRDAPIIAHKKLVEAKADELRSANGPANQWFSRWAREAINLAPYEAEFVQYLLGAIHEVESMSMKPLAETMKVIEKHRAKIDGWAFEEKPKNMMPALSVRDLVFA
jgi:hypothetical protein